jgi:hypothetical protein
MSVIQSLDLQFSAQFDKLESALKSMDKKIKTWSTGLRDGMKPMQLGIDSGAARMVKFSSGIGAIGKIAPSAFGSVTAGVRSVIAASGPLLAVALAAEAVIKAFTFLKDGVVSASNLNETLSKTDAVLGSASTGVKKFADEMTSKFGLIKGEVLDVASGIGGLGKGLGGLRGKDLEDFTVKFTKLAADMSSFKNISLREAGRAIQVGLSGEQSDQLKQLGVVTIEQTINDYAYAHGIAAVGAELTQQQKVMARAGVISKGLVDADGDLARTSGDTANQFRMLTGTIAKLGTSIGTAMLPAINAAIGAFTTFASATTGAFDGAKGSFDGFVANMVTGIDFVVSVFKNWPAVVEVAKIIAEKLLQIGDYIAVLGPNAAIIAAYIARNWVKLLTDAFNAVLAGLKGLWTNFEAIGTAIGEFLADPTKGITVKWTGLLDGFEATAEKLPELIKPHLTDMSKQIAEAGKPITDEIARRAESAKAKAAAIRPGLKDSPFDLEAPAGKKHEYKFAAAAVDVNSKEGYSAIIAATQGRDNGMEAIARKQLAAQLEANNLLRKPRAGAVAVPDMNI